MRWKRNARLRNCNEIHQQPLKKAGEILCTFLKSATAKAVGFRCAGVNYDIMNYGINLLVFFIEDLFKRNDLLILNSGMRMEIVLFFAAAVLSFISVFVIAKLNKKNNVVGIDVNKADNRILPESTGIAMLVPVAVLTIAYASVAGFRAELFVWLSVIGIISLVGFFDDVKHKLWHKRSALPPRGHTGSKSHA